MKKVRITTPENIELEVVLAEVLSRSAAACIDLIIQSALGFFLGWGFLAMINQLFVQGTTQYYGWLVGGLLILESVVIYGYYMISEIKMNGRTIGKKIMHLRVIKNNGGPVTVKDVVIRNLFRVFVDNFGVGILLMFFQRKNKRVGDLVAGTMVIIEETNERPIPLEEMVTLDEEVKQYLTDDEYNLLREYFERKRTMNDYETLRSEMRKYFTEKFEELGILEHNRIFIDQI